MTTHDPNERFQLVFACAPAQLDEDGANNLCIGLADNEELKRNEPIDPNRLIFVFAQDQLPEVRRHYKNINQLRWEHIVHRTPYTRHIFSHQR